MPSPRGSRSRLRLLSVLGLVATAAFPLGCGSDSGGGRLLSQKQAGELRGTLSAVEQDVAAKDCTAAADQVSTLQSQIDAIRRLDRDLRSALRASTRRLETLVQDKCQTTTPSEPQVQTTPTTPQEGTTGTTGASGPEGPKGKKPKKEKPPKTPSGHDEKSPPGQEGGGGGAGVPGESGKDAGGG